MDRRRDTQTDRCAPHTLAAVASGVVRPLLLRVIRQRRQFGLFLSQQARQGLPFGLVSLGRKLPAEVLDVGPGDELVHGSPSVRLPAYYHVAPEMSEA